MTNSGASIYDVGAAGGTLGHAVSDIGRAAYVAADLLAAGWEDVTITLVHKADRKLHVPSGTSRDAIASMIANAERGDP